MASPYPWHYTVRWPYYFCHPSVRNPMGMTPRPISHEFMPDARHDALRILFIGDIMVMQRDLIPELDPELAALLGSADLVVGNCESPVTHPACRPEARYTFVFKMATEYLFGIIGQTGLPAGRWAISVANNHAGDQGLEGSAATRAYLEAAGVVPIGFWSADGAPLVTLDCDGLRIGLVAWTQWVNIDVFRDNPGVWRMSHVESVPWVDVRRERSIDTLIGFPHWDYEFRHFPAARTRRFARRLVEGGFDIVSGSHPHVIQPMEWFAGGLCHYSVGNFCGLGIAWPVRLVSVLEMRICRRGPHRGKLAGYRLHPFVQVNSPDRIVIVPLAKAPSPRREWMTRRLAIVFDGS